VTRFVTALLLTLGNAAAVSPAVAADGNVSIREGEYVVLLHGLARTGRSMALLADRITEAGYLVFNVDYPSRDLPPGGLVTMVAAVLADCCAAAERIHFVTHSLGGIVVRAYLATSDEPRLGRVVMLSPPNRGSELVDILGDTWLFRAVMGPTSIQLGTRSDSLPNRLPPPDFDLGVIAATGTLNPIGSAAIPGRDDGVVSLCSTWTPGVRDIVTVAESHTFVMRSPEVARQTLQFLASGRFDHARSEKMQTLLAACGPDEKPREAASSEGN